MRMLLVTVLLSACGGPATRKPVAAESAPANHEAAAAPKAETEPVESVAATLGRAGLAGDRATAMSLTLTFDDLAKFSAKAQERKREDWDGEVKDFFDHLEREGREAGASAKVVGATIVKQGTLKASPGERILRDTDYAFVQLVIEQDGREARPQGVPMLFVRTDAGWRFSPKH